MTPFAGYKHRTDPALVGSPQATTLLCLASVAPGYAQSHAPCGGKGYGQMEPPAMV